MKQRTWPLLLIILVLVSALQYQSCCCLPAAAQPTKLTFKSEHSCCDSTATVTLDCSTFLQESKNCCGMMHQRTPAMANSLKLLDLNEEWIVKTTSICTGVLVDNFDPHESIAGVNRSPPRIRGFGSSDTYLYKKTLLI